MFQNTLPPPPPKSPSQRFFFPNQMQQRITMTANDITKIVELTWRSGSEMDCHVTAWGLIPDGNAVLTEFHVLRKGQ